MASVFDTRIDLYVADRFSRPLGTLERLLMRGDEGARRLAASLTMADRIQESSAASFARRSRIFQLQDLSQRQRMEREVVAMRTRTATQLEQLEAQHLQRRAQLEARAQGFMATAGSPYGPSPEALAANQALAAEQARYDSDRLTVQQRLNDLQAEGQRRTEAAMLRQQEMQDRQVLTVERQTAQHERILAQQRDLERATSSRRTGALMLGAGAIGIGADIATMHLIREGANLQQAALLLQMQTRGTPAEMGRFGDVARQVSGVTMFSLPQVYGLAGQMFGEGIGVAGGARRTINPIEQLLPLYARAAEDIFFLSGNRIDPNETIKAMAALSHQLSAYTPAQMAPVTDMLVRLAQIIPGQNLEPFVTAGGYILPQLTRTLRVSPEQILPLMAAGMMTVGSGQMGARGPFSGASLSRLFTQSLHPSKHGVMALAAMGMLGPGGVPNYLDPRTGAFNLPAFIGDLARFQGRLADPSARRQIAPVLGLPAGAASTQIEAAAFNMAFGAAGARPAFLLGDPKFVQLFENIEKALPNLLNAYDMQRQVLGLLNEQSLRLATNFQTLEADVGSRLVPGFQSLTSSLADATSRLDVDMRAHPAVATAAAEGIFGLGAFGTTAAATYLLRKGLMAFGWEAAGETLGAAAGYAFLGAVAAYFAAKGISAFGSTGNVYAPGTPLPPLDRSMHEALSGFSPAARASFYAHPVPAAAPGEPVSAHGGDLHVHGNLIVNVDKATAADTAELIAAIRRGARTTGSSTGGAGPESPGVHGFPIR